MTALSASPTPLKFHSKLNRFSRLFKVCLTTENFGPFDALLAQHVTAQVDHVATLRKSISHNLDDDDPIPALKRISLEHINSIEDAFADATARFSHAVANYDDDWRRVEEAWVQFTHDTKTSHTQAWERTRTAAYQVISRAPEDAQDWAVDLFITANAAVGTLVDKQLQATRNIASSLDGSRIDALRGKIHDAQVVNQTAAEVTGEWVRQVYEDGDGEDGVSLVETQAQTEAEAETETETVSSSVIEDKGVSRVSLRREGGRWQICGYE